MLRAGWVEGLKMIVWVQMWTLYVIKTGLSCKRKLRVALVCTMCLMSPKESSQVECIVRL